MDLYTSIGDARISSYPINPFAIPSEMVFAINVGVSCLSNDHLKFQSVLNALKVFSRKIAVNTVSGSLSLVRHARFSRVSEIIRQRNANHGESRKSQSLAESVSMVGGASSRNFSSRNMELSWMVVRFGSAPACNINLIQPVLNPVQQRTRL